jgi:hypothetical protein
MNTIRVIVAGENANGEPDFFFCKVKCSDLEISNGHHYDAAFILARSEGYEPKIVFDENDHAGKAIVDHFVWDSATEISV